MCCLNNTRISSKHVKKFLLKIKKNKQQIKRENGRNENENVVF